MASVSCIYGLGSPEEYEQQILRVHKGVPFDRDLAIQRLVDIQYERNQANLVRGKFRVQGDTVEVMPAYEQTAVRIEWWGDTVDRILRMDLLTGEVLDDMTEITVYPATHYVASEERLKMAIGTIEEELQERLALFERENKLLEAQRLRMRTNYDLEMLREMGFCSGIENYSRHLDGRSAGEPPYTLLDYFPEDWLCVIDESHVTVPQIHGMYEGDMSRKRTLVELRVPAAVGLTTTARCSSTSSTSGCSRSCSCRRRRGRTSFACPSRWWSRSSAPPGLVDPHLEVRPTKGQVDDLIEEIRKRTENEQRVLVTTLTKKMAEDLTDYLTELGLRVRYLHSEIDTVQRIEILRDLRLGEFDVLVGINLLREGLDLPEVSLVAILDADKEGFLRSETSLIQTIGRAARNVDGTVIMYADTVTDSMKQRHLRDRAPPADPGGLQPRARDRPADHPQEGQRHPAVDGLGSRGPRPCRTSAGASGRWGRGCRARSWSGSSGASRTRCTRPRRTSGSNTRPGCGTRSTSCAAS